jgi:hypothetical protein
MRIAGGITPEEAALPAKSGKCHAPRSRPMIVPVPVLPCRSRKLGVAKPVQPSFLEDRDDQPGLAATIAPLV